MNTGNKLPQLAICILEEQTQLTLADLCRACAVHAERIIELVDVGVLEPLGREPARWLRRHQPASRPYGLVPACDGWRVSGRSDGYGYLRLSHSTIKGPGTDC